MLNDFTEILTVLAVWPGRLRRTSGKVRARVCVCVFSFMYLKCSMAVVYTHTVVTFTLFRVSCPAASVYKRKHISAEVSKAV